MRDDHVVPRNIPQGNISRAGDKRSTTHSPAPDSLLGISRRLECRDYALAYLLDEHLTFTAEQITRMLFASERTCANRLTKLRKLGFVDWFAPKRPVGRLAAQWVAGLLSARCVALARDERPPTAAAVRRMQDRIAMRTHLGHLVGSNQLGVDLIAHARRNPGFALVRWWSGARISASCGGRVRPDVHGVWRAGGRDTPWYLEFDTGTEQLSTLVAKLGAYRRLREAGGPVWPVLFWLPSNAREANLHRVMAAAGVTGLGLVVATGSRDVAATVPGGPAGEVWRLLGNGPRRLALGELPSLMGEAGPFHPGPVTPEQDPLFLLHQP
jgi:hypothetical protein